MIPVILPLLIWLRLLSGNLQSLFRSLRRKASFHSLIFS